MYEVEFRLSKTDVGPLGLPGSTFNFDCFLKGTDTEVSSQQVWDWFEADLVIGVSVKRARPYIGVDLGGRPGFGKITAIRDGVIVLDDDEEIPSHLFHEWYTLD